MVKVLRRGSGKIDLVNFEDIRKGDLFAVNGFICKCREDAHLSEDPDYDGYLLYDTNNNSWFPEDLDEYSE